MSAYRLLLLFFIIHAINTIASTKAAFADCFTSDSLTQCISTVFSSHQVCFQLPSQSPQVSLSVDASCLAGTALNVTCNRDLWKRLGECLEASKDVTTGAICLPFTSEADCWTNAALLSGCQGQLSGICATAFQYPKENCTTLPPSLKQTRMCPIANALLLCADCPSDANLTLTDVSAVAAVRMGLQSANPFNDVFVFRNVSLYGSDTAALFSDLSRMVAGQEALFLIAGNNLPLFDALATTFAVQHQVFVMSYLRLPLTRTLTEYSRVLFLTGRTDLLTFVAGYTLAAQSNTGKLLFSSHYPATTFERTFFIGFAAGATAMRGANGTVLWGTTVAESRAAWGSYGIDAFSSGVTPQLLYPFLSNSTGVGVFADYLNDRLTFNGQNSTQSRNLLFSVTANLNFAITAQFQAAGTGYYKTGLYSGDAEVASLTPCVYSCETLKPQSIFAMKRSFSLIHHHEVENTIDYTTGEFAYTTASTSASLSLTGASYPMDMAPQVVAFDAERIILLALHEVQPEYRVAMMSMTVRHVQPMLLMPRSLPSRRQDYAVAADPTSGAVYISMGMSLPEPGVLLSDMWVLQVNYFLQLSQLWNLVNTTFATPNSVPSARIGHTMTIVNGVMYLYGGLTTSGSAVPQDTALYRWNTSSGQWISRGASANAARAYHSVQLLSYQEGKTIGGTTCHHWLAVLGGVVLNAFADGVSFYCPEANVWIDVPLLSPSNYDGTSITTTSPWLNGRERLCVSLLSQKLGSGLLLVVGGGLSAPIVINIAAAPGVAQFSAADGLPVDVLAVGTLPPLTSHTCSSCTVATSAMRLSNTSATLLLTNGSSLSMASVFYPESVICASGGAEVATFSRLRCVLCPVNTYADSTGLQCLACHSRADNPRCSDSFSQVLVGVATSLVGIFCIIALPLSIQGIRSFQNLRRMEQSERIGVELAESISTLEFDRLGFLATLQNPSRLERGFLTILHILVTYMQFMPMWVLAGDRNRSDGRDAGLTARESSSGGDEEEGAMLPHAMPRQSIYEKRGKPSTSIEEDSDSSSGTLDQRRRMHNVVHKFQRRMYEAWMVVLHVKMTSIEDAFMTPHADQRGHIHLTPDIKRLSTFYAQLAERVDRFGGLIETQLNHRLIVTFNSLRVNHEPELSAVRCALALNALIPGLTCGISCGYALVGIVGKRFGKYSTMVGYLLREAVLWCESGRRAQCNVVVPYHSMKNQVGAKIVLKVIGDARGFADKAQQQGGSLLSAAAANAPPSLVPPSSIMSDRVLLASVLGRRRDFSASQLQSLDACNTALEYIHSGAIAAARQHLERCNRGASVPSLSDDDRKMVDRAIERGLVEPLDRSVAW